MPFEKVDFQKSSPSFSSFRTEQYIFSENTHAPDLLKVLNEFRHIQYLTDFTVIVEGRSFSCHKSVLAAASPYFKALFVHDTDHTHDRELCLEAISHVGFSQILDFVYTSSLTISSADLQDILEAADFLQFRGIVEKCSDILLQYIAIDNCLALENLAAGHLCQGLREASQCFILQNFEEVTDTNDFLSLPYSQLVELLEIKQNHVFKSPTQVLVNVLKWINTTTDERVIHVAELLSFIPLADIPVDDITGFLTEFPFLKEFLLGPDSGLSCGPDNGNLIETCSEYFVGKQSSYSDVHGVLVVIPKEAKKDNSVPNSQRELTDPRNVYFLHPKEQRWRVLTKLPFNNRMLYSVTVAGNIVYVTGGEEYEEPLTSVWLYDVSSGESWKKTTPMLEPRANHSSASTLGNVYVVGGRGSASKELRDTIEMFCPMTEQWTLLPSQLACGGLGRCAVFSVGDKLFVIGGTESYVSKTGEVGRRQYQGAQYLDLRRHEWHKAERLTAHMILHGVSVGVGDCMHYKGMVLIIDEDKKGRRIKVYNPVTETVHDYIRSHGQHRFGGYSIDGDVLYCTGGVVDRFRPHDLVHSRQLLATDAEWMMSPSLPRCLSHHSCVIVNKVLDVGGELPEYEDCAFSNLAQQKSAGSVLY